MSDYKKKKFNWLGTYLLVKGEKKKLKTYLHNGTAICKCEIGHDVIGMDHPCPNSNIKKCQKHLQEFGFQTNYSHLNESLKKKNSSFCAWCDIENEKEMESLKEFINNPFPKNPDYKIELTRNGHKVFYRGNQVLNPGESHDLMIIGEDFEKKRKFNNISANPELEEKFLDIPVLDPNDPTIALNYFLNGVDNDYVIFGQYIELMIIQAFEKIKKDAQNPNFKLNNYIQNQIGESVLGFFFFCSTFNDNSFLNISIRRIKLSPEYTPQEKFKKLQELNKTQNFTSFNTSEMDFFTDIYYLYKLVLDDSFTDDELNSAKIKHGDLITGIDVKSLILKEKKKEKDIQNQNLKILNPEEKDPKAIYKVKTLTEYENIFPLLDVKQSRLFFINFRKKLNETIKNKGNTSSWFESKLKKIIDLLSFFMEKNNQNVSQINGTSDSTINQNTNLEREESTDKIRTMLEVSQKMSNVEFFENGEIALVPLRRVLIDFKRYFEQKEIEEIFTKYVTEDASEEIIQGIADYTDPQESSQLPELIDTIEKILSKEIYDIVEQQQESDFKKLFFSFKSISEAAKKYLNEKTSESKVNKRAKIEVDVVEITNQNVFANQTPTRENVFNDKVSEEEEDKEYVSFFGNERGPDRSVIFEYDKKWFQKKIQEINEIEINLTNIFISYSEAKSELNKAIDSIYETNDIVSLETIQKLNRSIFIYIENALKLTFIFKSRKIVELLSKNQKELSYYQENSKFYNFFYEDLFLKVDTLRKIKYSWSSFIFVFEKFTEDLLLRSESFTGDVTENEYDQFLTFKELNFQSTTENNIKLFDDITYIFNSIFFILPQLNDFVETLQKENNDSPGNNTENPVISSNELFKRNIYNFIFSNPPIPKEKINESRTNIRNLKKIVEGFENNEKDYYRERIVDLFEKANSNVVLLTENIQEFDYTKENISESDVLKNLELFQSKKLDGKSNLASFYIFNAFMRLRQISNDKTLKKLLESTYPNYIEEEKKGNEIKSLKKNDPYEYHLLFNMGRYFEIMLASETSKKATPDQTKYKYGTYMLKDGKSYSYFELPHIYTYKLSIIEADKYLDFLINQTKVGIAYDYRNESETVRVVSELFSNIIKMFNKLDSILNALDETSKIQEKMASIAPVKDIPDIQSPFRENTFELKVQTETEYIIPNELKQEMTNYRDLNELEKFIQAIDDSIKKKEWENVLNGMGQYIFSQLSYTIQSEGYSLSRFQKDEENFKDPSIVDQFEYGSNSVNPNPRLVVFVPGNTEYVVYYYRVLFEDKDLYTKIKNEIIKFSEKQQNMAAEKGLSEEILYSEVSETKPIGFIERNAQNKTVISSRENFFVEVLTLVSRAKGFRLSSLTEKQHKEISKSVFGIDLPETYEEPEFKTDFYDKLITENPKIGIRFEYMKNLWFGAFNTMSKLHEIEMPLVEYITGKKQENIKISNIPVTLGNFNPDNIIISLENNTIRYKFINFSSQHWQFYPSIDWVNLFEEEQEFRRGYVSSLSEEEKHQVFRYLIKILDYLSIITNMKEQIEVGYQNDEKSITTGKLFVPRLASNSALTTIEKLSNQDTDFLDELVMKIKDKKNDTKKMDLVSKRLSYYYHASLSGMFMTMCLSFISKEIETYKYWRIRKFYEQTVENIRKPLRMKLRKTYLEFQWESLFSTIRNSSDTEYRSNAIFVLNKLRKILPNLLEERDFNKKPKQLKTEQSEEDTKNLSKRKELEEEIDKINEFFKFHIDSIMRFFSPVGLHYELAGSVYGKRFPLFPYTKFKALKTSIRMKVHVEELLAFVEEFSESNRDFDATETFIEKYEELLTKSLSWRTNLKDQIWILEDEFSRSLLPESLRNNEKLIEKYLEIYKIIDTYTKSQVDFFRKEPTRILGIKNFIESRDISKKLQEVVEILLNSGDADEEINIPIEEYFIGNYELNVKVDFELTSSETKTITKQDFINRMNETPQKKKRVLNLGMTRFYEIWLNFFEGGSEDEKTPLNTIKLYRSIIFTNVYSFFVFDEDVDLRLLLFRSEIHNNFLKKTIEIGEKKYLRFYQPDEQDFLQENDDEEEFTDFIEK